MNKEGLNKIEKIYFSNENKIVYVLLKSGSIIKSYFDDYDREEESISLEVYDAFIADNEDENILSFINKKDVLLTLKFSDILDISYDLYMLKKTA